MPDEHMLALRQADQARTDFAALESDLQFIMGRLARMPTRGDLARSRARDHLLLCGVHDPILLDRLALGDDDAGKPHYRAGGRVRLCRPAFGQGIPIP
jgi:hypothetical protein